MTIKDEQIWEDYTQGITPVQKKPRKSHTVKSMPEQVVRQRAAEKEPPKLPTLSDHNPLGGVSLILERKREKNLRQGEIVIDAKLDLHGMTQIEAFEALTVFMHKKAAAGKRHLLIITGKGRGGEGVLRTNLKKWLGQLPEAPLILALRPAAAKHGGDGAFYIVLRKT